MHLGAHWTCAVVDLQRRAIYYYDSMLVRFRTLALRWLLYCATAEAADAALAPGRWQLAPQHQIRTMQGASGVLRKAAASLPDAQPHPSTRNCRWRGRHMITINRFHTRFDIFNVVARSHKCQEAQALKR